MENEELLKELSQNCGISSQEYLNILKNIKSKDNNDLSIESINMDEEVKKTTSKVRLLTGIPEIDNLTKGLGTGVHVLAGFRKCCKSTLALNLIYRALNEGLNVCLISLEMSKIDVINTLVSLHSFEVNPQSAITRDELSMMYELDREQYNDYLYSFMSLPGDLIIYTEKDIEDNVKRPVVSVNCPANFNSLFNKANSSCYYKTGKPVQVLVVDNINCIRSWNGSSGENAYSNISNFFRQSSLNFGDRLREGHEDEENYRIDYDDDDCYGNTPVICLLLCQINRTGGKEALYNGFYPDSCVAETVNIERDATTIIPIYTNQMYIESNIAMVKLEASRYSKAMLGPVEVPVYLQYGKIGYPIEHINMDEEKKKALLFQNNFRMVRVELPDGDIQEIILPKDAPLPDGYRETDKILLSFMEDEDDEE